MTEQALFLAALVIGFYMAWNIGANDVANAFGTAIGSGTLTFRRALVLAAIFEFSGAFFVGGHVTETIRGEIVAPALFADAPRLFAAGMLAALLGAAVWLHVATFYGQPVSTTHAIIGAVIGFGVVALGPDCVQWHRLLRIAASWVISPVAGGLLAFAIYAGIRKFILRSRDPATRACAAVPLGLGAVVFVMVFSVLQYCLARWQCASCFAGLGLWLPAAFSLLAAVAGSLLGRLWLRRQLCRPAAGAPPALVVVEGWFGHLELLTACYMSFAHGANDVANAIAPVAGILQALHGQIGAQSAVPSWVLAYGGVGIVAGLAMYGRKVIEAVGRKITEITPTRGFSAAFATASTVLFCSLLGLPISTTFVLVGAVMGVGFARGFGAIDLAVVRRIFISWLVTIPAAALFSMMAYWIILALWR